MCRGMVGRWAMPPDPKFKKVGGAKEHPPNLGPFGVSCPFLKKKFKILSLGLVAHFWILVSVFFSFIGVGVVVEVWCRGDVGG